jgi:ribonuclease P protein component
VRRRLREVVRLTEGGGMLPGHDYVLVGRRATLGLAFERLMQDFNGALRRVHHMPTRPGDTRRPRTGSRTGGDKGKR